MEFNIGGWFLNWESDNDWMGQNRKEDKEYLREFLHINKNWKTWEMEELILKLKACEAEGYL